MTVRDPQERQPLVQEDRRATPEHQAWMQAMVNDNRDLRALIADLTARVEALETP